MNTPPEPAPAVTEPAAVWIFAAGAPTALAPPAGVVSVTAPVTTKRDTAKRRIRRTAPPSLAL
jgi:hypothetical protein